MPSLDKAANTAGTVVTQAISQAKCEAQLLKVLASSSRWVPKNQRDVFARPGLTRKTDRKGIASGAFKRRMSDSSKFKGWHVCHVWDEGYRNDPQSYSRFCNMVLLPPAFHCLLDHWNPAKELFRYSFRNGVRSIGGEATPSFKFLTD
jgi:hypothetical protein